MSNHIYLGNLKNKKKKKTLTNITLAVFVIFSLIYLYISSTIGIYINGDFYRKSPSLTNINYYAVSSSADIQNIELISNIDKSYLIKIDGESAIVSNIVYDKENDTYSMDIIEGEFKDGELFGLDKNQFAKIALQETEVRRQPIHYYIIPFLLLLSLSLLRKYSTEIHNKLFKDKLFSEKYFSLIDYLPIYFAYIIMAILTITL